MHTRITYFNTYIFVVQNRKGSLHKINWNLFRCKMQSRRWPWTMQCTLGLTTRLMFSFCIFSCAKTQTLLVIQRSFIVLALHYIIIIYTAWHFCTNTIVVDTSKYIDALWLAYRRLQIFKQKQKKTQNQQQLGTQKEAKCDAVKNKSKRKRMNWIIIENQALHDGIMHNCCL